MAEVVLDASALLALLTKEPGAERVAQAIPGAVISAVNLSEVVAKLTGGGMPPETARQLLSILGLEVVSFDEEHAYETGFLHVETKDFGLSLGDRACLGLARSFQLPVLTADRAWQKLSIGVTVQPVR